MSTKSFCGIAFVLWTMLTCYAPYTVASSVCVNLTIPVTVSARTGIFDIPPLDDDYQVTRFIQNETSLRGNFTDQALVGYRDEQGTYNISAQYCTPGQNTSQSETLIFLLHGFGADKSYWHYPYNNFNYSFANVATTAGYSTFAIDRLGYGNSSHPDGLQTVQTLTQLSVVQNLLSFLRAGTVPGVPVPRQLILMGHSYGSTLSIALPAVNSTLVDGVVLTGISADNVFDLVVVAMNAQAAAKNQPDRFGDLDSTYLTWSDNSANQYIFFSTAFDHALIQYTEDHKSTYTMGEILTFAAAPQVAPNFRGPVLVVTGDEDIYCQGDCYATGQNQTYPAQLSSAFPSASAFETFIPNNTAHGLNFHYTAASSYATIINFLGAHGF